MDLTLLVLYISDYTVVLLLSEHAIYNLHVCSMKDGLLLKPTRPAMSLDSTFTQRAFGEGGPKGQLWAGYTMYGQSQVSWNQQTVKNTKLFSHGVLTRMFGCGTAMYTQWNLLM